VGGSDQITVRQRRTRTLTDKPQASGVGLPWKDLP
jgi:hypothetical protein